MDARTLLVIGAALVITATAPACGSDSTSTAVVATATATEPAASPTAAASPSEPAASAPSGTADWQDSTKQSDLGDGLIMAACEGDAPFLCITRGTEAVGVVEGLRFPVESFTSLDPSADVGENLRSLAGTFVESLRTDRAAGCPPGYTVEALPPADLVLGGFEALSYGYIGTNADGTPSELNLQYATVEGGDIVLVTAIAYEAGGCPGRDDQSSFDSATLAALQPRLEAALREMPLPPPLPGG